MRPLPLFGAEPNVPASRLPRRTASSVASRSAGQPRIIIMSLSAIPATPVNSYPTAPISAPSPASSTSNSPPTSGAPDRPNDGDADDKSSVFALGVTIDNYIYIYDML